MHPDLILAAGVSSPAIADAVASAIRLTTPLLLTALGAVFTERGGVVNIGLEGMMIFGAFWSAWGAYTYGPLAGLAIGAVAGAIMALVHAIVSVTFRVDQIVSGVAINTLAYGLVRVASQALFHSATTSPSVPSLPRIDVPVLDQIPALQPLMANLSPLIVFAFVLVPVSWWVLNRTVFGLRLRSVGENPLAADTLGINVVLMRYSGVLISGLLAGLAGGYLAVEQTSMYVEGMTAGRGFVALAAMIFGNWTPVGAMFASLLFGLADSLSIRVTIPHVPYQFVNSLPYILTIVVLAGAVGHARAPAADGVPYERSGE